MSQYFIQKKTEYGRKTLKIRIEKINGRIRLFKANYYNHLMNLIFPDCSEPTFIITEGKVDYEEGDFCISIIHFGSFEASYKKNKYTSQDELIVENYKSFNISEFTPLPLQEVHIFKIQCHKPGILSFFYNI